MGAVIAEPFNRTFGDLPLKTISQSGKGNWVDILPIIAKQFINRTHSSSKLNPNQASSKTNEVYNYLYLLDKRREIKTKYKIGYLVRTADLKKMFSKGDTTNWSYKLYEI